MFKPQLKELIVFLLILTMFSLATIEEVHATELVLGGWSDHQLEDDLAQAQITNEVHNTFGVVLDNGLTMVTYKNSYSKQAAIVGYNHQLLETGDKEGFHLDLSFTAGLVTGYTSEQAGPLSLAEGLSVYVMPTIGVGYNRLTMDIGMVPVMDGKLFTVGFRINLG